MTERKVRVAHHRLVKCGGIPYGRVENQYYTMYQLQFTLLHAYIDVIIVAAIFCRRTNRLELVSRRTERRH